MFSSNSESRETKLMTLLQIDFSRFDFSLFFSMLQHNLTIYKYLHYNLAHPSIRFFDGNDYKIARVSDLASVSLWEFESIVLLINALNCVQM